MSDEAHERRRHFRGKARPGRVLPVRYRIGGGAWAIGETKNVGIGGAFIAGDGGGGAVPGAAVGAPIEVELSLPHGDRPLPLRGIVRRLGGDGEAGVGVEFVDVDVDILLELNDYFATLTGREPE